MSSLPVLSMHFTSNSQWIKVKSTRGTVRPGSLLAKTLWDGAPSLLVAAGTKDSLPRLFIIILEKKGELRPGVPLPERLCWLPGCCAKLDSTKLLVVSDMNDLTCWTLCFDAVTTRHSAWNMTNAAGRSAAWGISLQPRASHCFNLASKLSIEVHN